jgi:hypothetical protein
MTFKTLRSAAIAAAALLAVPAAASADVIDFGSDLSAPANVAEAHGADTAFWGLAVKGKPGSAPASGQITEIRLKGTALPSVAAGAPAPLNEVHIQVVHPQPDGSVTVSLSTDPFYVPIGGNPNQVSAFHPAGYLCVQKGDYITFNDEGGFAPPFYPDGVPFQVFANVPGSTTAQFTRDNGTNIGANFSGAPKAGQELLMQMTLTTGYDASTVCGGMKGQEFKGVQIAPQTTVVRKRVARVRATCPGTSRQSCDGVIKLLAGSTVIGQASFSIPSTATTNIKVPVTKAADKKILKSRKLKVSVAADAHDALGRTLTTRTAVTLQSAKAKKR